jgi:hypothetical protein
MKNLYHYLSNIEKSRTSLQEGQSIDFVLNEEYSIRTDIVAVDGRDVYVGLDRRAYELLERAGVMELAGDAGYTGSQGTPLGGTTKPVATTQANAPVAKPVTKPTAAAPNSGSSYTGPIGTATNNPAPKKAAKPTAAATTNANVKAANAAFVANQAKAPQGDQTAGGKTNADFLPGAAGGAKPAAAPAAADSGANAATAMASKSATTDSGPQSNTFGIQPQANIQGSPTGTSAAAPATATTTAPQSNTFGVQSQANIPGSPTGTSAAAPATAPSALPITTTGGPTAANPASVNPATQGGPAVTGGFGQQTNISQDSDDVIAQRGPMGTTKPTAADRAQGEKNLQGVKNFLGFGGGSTPAAPASPPPATIEEAPRELDRVLQLAGVKRG